MLCNEIHYPTCATQYRIPYPILVDNNTKYYTVVPTIGSNLK